MGWVTFILPVYSEAHIGWFSWDDEGLALPSSDFVSSSV